MKASHKSMQPAGRLKRWARLVLAVAAFAMGYPSHVVSQDETASAEFRYELLADDQMSEWVITGCEVEVDQGEMRLVDGNGFIRLAHPLRDFEFGFSFKPEKSAAWDSGLYFRSDMPTGDSPWPRRYQINLKENEVGRLLGVDGGNVPAGLIRSGDWNSLRLRVVGSQATLHINGQLAWQVEGLEPQSGYLGFQSEVPLGGSFRFKEIWVTELDSTSLFDGSTLAGWTPAGGNENKSWEVRDGMLVCTGAKGSWLRLDQQQTDFNLRLEYLLKDHGNSGVYLRVPEDGNHHGEGSGIEVQILDDNHPGYAELNDYQYSGSLYAIVPAEPRVSRGAGQWNLLEIDAQGQHYRVWHNGHLVVDATADEHPELEMRRVAGYLGLQNHSEEVLFRRLRLSSSYPIQP